MEANIKINTVMRVLGSLVSTMFLVMVIFSFFSNKQIPIDVVISGAIFILSVAPVCIYGYISGKILDKLPTFLVNAIKGKYSKG
jgi:ABC-type sugar transport system permease subunit